MKTIRMLLVLIGLGLIEACACAAGPAAEADPFALAGSPPMGGRKQSATDYSGKIKPPEVISRDPFGEAIYGPATIVADPVTLDLVQEYVRQTIDRFFIEQKIAHPRQLKEFLVGKDQYCAEFKHAIGALSKVPDSKDRNVLRAALQKAVEGIDMASKDKARQSMLPDLFRAVVEITRVK